MNSFTQYTFRVYAFNELGASPKSQLLTLQTLENGKFFCHEDSIGEYLMCVAFAVPLTMISDLTAILWENSSVRITWSLTKNDWRYLHGKFRTFAVTVYINFSKAVPL